MSRNLYSPLPTDTEEASLQLEDKKKESSLVSLPALKNGTITPEQIDALMEALYTSEKNKRPAFWPLVRPNNSGIRWAVFGVANAFFLFSCAAMWPVASNLPAQLLEFSSIWLLPSYFIAQLALFFELSNPAASYRAAHWTTARLGFIIVPNLLVLTFVMIAARHEVLANSTSPWVSSSLVVLSFMFFCIQTLWNPHIFNPKTHETFKTAGCLSAYGFFILSGILGVALLLSFDNRGGDLLISISAKSYSAVLATDLMIVAASVLLLAMLNYHPKFQEKKEVKSVLTKPKPPVLRSCNIFEEKPQRGINGVADAANNASSNTSLTPLDDMPLRSGDNRGSSFS